MNRLMIVKPDGLPLLHEIVKTLSDKNINVLSIMTEKITLEKANALYAEHEEQYFFNTLLRYITAAPCLVMLLEGNNDNITEAKISIRKLVKEKHASGYFDDERFKEEFLATFDGVHCSDPASSRREIKLFFEPNSPFLTNLNRLQKDEIVQAKLVDKAAIEQSFSNLRL